MIIIIFYTFWCVLHYYTAWRPRGGDKIRPTPPPLENREFFGHIGGLFATFSFMWVFLLRGFMVFFFVLPPPPHENFCGRPCYTVSVNFLVTLDTYAENKPTIDCLGGGCTVRSVGS